MGNSGKCLSGKWGIREINSGKCLSGKWYRTHDHAHVRIPGVNLCMYLCRNFDGIPRENRVRIPRRKYELITEGFYGGICGRIPRETTKRITGRFLVGAIPCGIADRILVIIFWDGFLKQSLLEFLEEFLIECQEKSVKEFEVPELLNKSLDDSWVEFLKESLD